MNIFKVSPELLSKYYEIDNKVMLKDSRPYVGIVFEINKYKYFAPLTSAK